MKRRRNRRRNPKRQRNQASNSNRVAFVLGIVGAAAGVGVGYWIATTKAARDTADKMLEGWRLPQPGFRVHLPEDPNDYQRLDDEVCDCAESILDDVAEDADLEIVVGQIQLCIAHRLHPDFGWPPVRGDHPSVDHLWALIGMTVRRAIITDQICDSPVPPPHPIPIPTEDA